MRGSGSRVRRYPVLQKKESYAILVIALIGVRRLHYVFENLDELLSLLVRLSMNRRDFAVTNTMF